MLATTMTTTMVRLIVIFIGLQRHGVADMLTLPLPQRTVQFFSSMLRTNVGNKNHDDTDITMSPTSPKMNHIKGVTVEFIESEYDKVIYQAFIKPRNK